MVEACSHNPHRIPEAGRPVFPGFIFEEVVVSAMGDCVVPLGVGAVDRISCGDQAIVGVLLGILNLVVSVGPVR